MSISDGKNLAYHEYDSNSAPQFVFSEDQYPEPIHSGNYPSEKASSGRVLALNELPADKLSDRDVSLKASPVDSPLAKSSVVIQKARLRRTFTIVGLAISIILIAIAVALGAYFGHRAVVDKAISSSTPSSDGQLSNSSSSVPSSGDNSNPAFAMNGTSIASTSYSSSLDGDPTSLNYVVFYQHSSGDIRKLVYNESKWYSSDFVTSDAATGTGLACIWFWQPGSNSPVPRVYVYYTDKKGYLQELRGNHGSNEWVNGTLGAAAVKPTYGVSTLSAQYTANCSNQARGWLWYESDGGIQEARWSATNDTWSQGDLIPGHKPGADFVFIFDPYALRMFHIDHGLQVQEYICEQCCSVTSTNWAPGLIATSVMPSDLSLGGNIIAGPRLVYYQDASSTIRELNNTGNTAVDPSPDMFVTNSSSVNGVNTGTLSLNSSGSAVISAMPGSKLSMVPGQRGTIWQAFLFFQVNGTDITNIVRDYSDTGDWSQPTALPVGASTS